MNKHLLSAGDLTAGDIPWCWTPPGTWPALTDRAIKKVPTLRGRTVCNLFFEDSTRTRISFELAAKRLSADVINFTAKGSSGAKGESLKDTAITLEAMGVDAIVIRHPASGAPVRLANWVKAHVVNAGDGTHEHPTQALLDLYTMRQHFPSFDGLRVAIVGDVLHPRVARSNVLLLKTMGAEVTLVAPPTLLPTSVDRWGSASATTWTRSCPRRGDDAAHPAGAAVGRVLPVRARVRPAVRAGTRRLDAMPDSSIVMHPGPMNRGVEIAAEVADSIERSVIASQVSNGIHVRMGLLYLLLGGRRRTRPPARGGARMKPLSLKGGRLIDPASGHDAVADVLVRDGIVAEAGRAGRHRGRGRRRDGLVVSPWSSPTSTSTCASPAARTPRPSRPGRWRPPWAATPRSARCLTTSPADNAGVVEMVAARGREVGLVELFPVGAVTVARAGERARRAGRHGPLGRRRRHLLRRRQPHPRGAAAAPGAGVRPRVRRRHRRPPRGPPSPRAPRCTRASCPGCSGCRGWPAAAEDMIVARDLMLAELTGGRPHLCHLSMARAGRAGPGGQGRGSGSPPRPPRTTSPHRRGPGLLRPRLQGQPAAAGQGRRRGRPAGPGRRHDRRHRRPTTPHPRGQGGRAGPPPAGCSALETALGVAITELVEPGWLTMAQAIERLTAGPARCRRLPGHGGPAADGRPANLTVFDPAATWTVAARGWPAGRATPRSRARELHGRVVTRTLPCARPTVAGTASSRIQVI